MTTFLVAAVAVLAVVTLVNLFVTLAIITRLRRPAAPHGAAWTVDALPVGAPMPAVSFDAVDGTTVDFADPPAGGRTLLAFVAAHCSPCHEQLPRLRDLVATMAARGERAIVVVLTFTDRAVDFADAFDGLAPVVLQGEDERVSRSFEVTGYPTYVTFDAGVRTTAAATVDDLVGAAA